jgi:hypothetical protein
MATQKVFAFVNRDVSSAQKITQPLAIPAGKNPRTSNSREGNHNYKGCMASRTYKRVSPCIMEKMVAPEVQLRTGYSKHTDLVQLEVPILQKEELKASYKSK